MVLVMRNLVRIVILLTILIGCKQSRRRNNFLYLNSQKLIFDDFLRLQWLVYFQVGGPIRQPPHLKNRQIIFWPKPSSTVCKSKDFGFETKLC